MRGVRIKITLKAGHHRPAIETPLNAGLVDLLCFKGFGPVLLGKLTLNVCDFRGVRAPALPSGFAHGLAVSFPGYACLLF